MAHPPYFRNGGANIILCGMPRSLSTLEIHAKLADIGEACVGRGNMRWEGDHVKIVVKPEDSIEVLLKRYIVTRISACLRSIGCRCVLDEVGVAHKQQVQL